MKDGRLCAKDLLNRNELSKLQTDFYEQVSKRWGLQRGKEGSTASHLSTAEFKAKCIVDEAWDKSTEIISTAGKQALRELETIEKAVQKADEHFTETMKEISTAKAERDKIIEERNAEEDYSQALEDAKQGKCAKSKNGLRNQIIVLTAEVNEWYARDTSKKIRAVFKTKGNSGKHLSSNPPFGYIKAPNDKDKWIIDEEAALIVKEIFDLYIGGMSIPKIARLLTDRKVPTPQLYNVQRGRKIHKPSEYMELWNPQTVKGLLSQHAYAGRTVNFTTIKKSFKNKKQVCLPKENWVVFENTQETIIEPKIFDMVQKMRETKRAYTKFNEVSMFTGMLYCMDCKNKLTMQRFEGKREMDNYTCATYRKKKKGLCTSHRILVSRLDKLF